MKTILLYIMIYGISLAVSLTVGGVYIGEASLTPFFMAIGTVFMALVWRAQETPDTMNYPESNDVKLTYEEKRTMLLASSKTLYASLPLQLLLIFTWHPFLKTLFSIVGFLFGIGIGFHIGRRKIRGAVYARMNRKNNE